jgi:hypothetical protein
MARTDLTVQEIVKSGLEPSYTSASADGHAVANNGRTFLHVKNGGGSPITVTIQTSTTIEGLAVADQTVSVPASEERLIGPFSTHFEQPSGADKGKVYVDFSDVTSVTVAALRV